MKKTALIFPGQGAQKIGMGKDFYETFSASREVYDQAGEWLDMDVKSLCFEAVSYTHLDVYKRQYLLRS